MKKFKQFFIEKELDALIDVSQENIADREDEVNY